MKTNKDKEIYDIKRNSLIERDRLAILLNNSVREVEQQKGIISFLKGQVERLKFSLEMEREKRGSKI